MKNFISVISLFSILYCQKGYTQVAMVSKTGSGNWHAIGSWKSKNNLTGTITSSTGSATITGTGTSFLSEINAGTILYQTNGTTVIGTVSSISTNTTLTLTGNASVNQTNQQFRVSKIPAAGDTVIVDDNNTIFVTANASCTRLELASGGNDTDIRLSAGITLTVSGTVVIYPGTGNGDNREVAVQDGILTCGGVTINDTGNDNRWSKLSVNQGTINVTGDINMYAPAGNTRNQLAFTNDGTVNVTGNFSGGGDILPASTTKGLVNYNRASGNQTVKADTYADITFSGGATKTLAGAAIITDVATFTNGIVYTTATNLLTINAAGSVTGATNSSFVHGPVEKLGNTAFTFPVGKAGAGYHFCAISVASSSQSITAEYMRASGIALGPITASGLMLVSNCEYWNINRSGGSSSVDVTLSWNGSSNCNAAAYVTDLSSLTVAHFNGTTWDTHGKNSTTGNASSGTVTRNAVSVFSPFTIGSTSIATNPLPLKFEHIYVNKTGEQVQVNWSILTESDVDHYEIERSADNREFISIGKKLPELNNGEKAEYSWLDTYISSGIYFYRVKAVFKNDRYTYSTVVKLNFYGETSAFTIYPNPVKAKEKISIKAGNLAKGNYTIRIYNNLGQFISKQELTHPGGIFTQELVLPQRNLTGINSLQIEKDGKSTGVLFIVNE
jgi:hypothetical protein